MIKLDQVVKRTRLVQHTDQTPQDPMQKRHVYIVVQRRPQRLYLSVLHQLTRTPERVRRLLYIDGRQVGATLCN